MGERENKIDRDFEKMNTISRIEGKSDKFIYAIIGFSLLLLYDLVVNDAKFSVVIIVLIVFSFYMSRKLKKDATAMKQTFYSENSDN
ncbi:hypothetical protein [Rhodohalobacter barkolensis]|uniref:FUSC family protein n=1 Tax=Rhodohalobacter barkolensis TaxID=2053187 RepID=A0A2N0VH22_9BACT|nr:hypothetical protein [Rhodohalobacter barkolensis]PKD43464.1 hypothetical protein CWD77_07790 [Rhodohalobacter barkolensis]